MRVLVAEDDEILRRLLENMVTRAGHQVFSVASGEEGVQHLRESGLKYDLIMTDIDMGVMSGIDFLRIVKENDLAVGARFLIMSGRPPSNILKICTELGAMFLQKPFRGLDTLSRFIEGKGK